MIEDKFNSIIEKIEEGLDFDVEFSDFSYTPARTNCCADDAHPSETYYTIDDNEVIITLDEIGCNISELIYVMDEVLTDEFSCIINGNTFNLPLSFRMEGKNLIATLTEDNVPDSLIEIMIDDMIYQ